MVFDAGCVAGQKNLRFTVINLDVEDRDESPFAVRHGNACTLSEYADDSFDVVHSNSVIEHVGHWPQMMQMAREVRRLAPAYFVQTPNFWFPIEPHYQAALFHYLPEIVRAKLLLKKRYGFRGPCPTFAEAMCCVQSINLLSESGLRDLFPDAQIDRERCCGLTKSLTAWRFSGRK